MTTPNYGNTLMQPLLQVRNLTLVYGSDRQPVPAVTDLSFDVAAGEAVGLLGESGCGKTTLGLALLRLLPAAGRVARGSIVFSGTDLLTLGERELERIRGAEISMVYQEPGMALNPVLRVGDQIAEVLRAHGALNWTRSREEAKALLAQVGLPSDSGIDQAYPHQLSGGQKQRAVIAQAIACRPALIIADEPTASLDAVTQSEIRTLLKTLQTKLHLALLLISHDPGELEQMVERILVMYAGYLVEAGGTQEVLERPLHPYTQGLLRARLSNLPSENHKKPLAVIPGEPPDPARLPMGCIFEPRCPDSAKLCGMRTPPEFQPEASRRVACFNYAP
jgi:oligopeptide/dipeptide ABC transporter ATP-binding protein